MSVIQSTQGPATSLVHTPTSSPPLPWSAGSWGGAARSYLIEYSETASSQIANATAVAAGLYGGTTYKIDLTTTTLDDNQYVYHINGNNFLRVDGTAGRVRMKVAGTNNDVSVTVVAGQLATVTVDWVGELVSVTGWSAGAANALGASDWSALGGDLYVGRDSGGTNVFDYGTLTRPYL